jgi:hypothetical protein
MSKHKTSVPVNVASVIAALPKNSYVHSAELNEARDGVDIVWENDAIKTPYTFPVEYPLDKLRPAITGIGVLIETEEKISVDKTAKNRRSQP